ncbi:Tetratricopeptide repeat containing protein, Hsp40 [Pseudoloma neurophilia]|uniref:Tetratricopeptide repeat containing protein, Hsp40 n=1 Tax=Pseudoloma neurophilia TaxID=146866 RepID=A0A0R0LWS2_9MICR|nr:Tetratricopeptide repeat containing protein, Hsp40 [Pseudoloma neurophilia]
MTEKRNICILTTVICVSSGLLYLGYKKYKEFKRTKQAKDIKQIGNQFFKEKNYEQALEKYQEALNLTEKSDYEHLKILNNISLTYFLLKKYKESLEYSDKYLEIDKINLRILKRRFETNRNMENNTETLTDAFILSILDEKFATLGKTTLSGIVERITEQKMETLKVFPGKIAVQEYFDTFPEISKVYHSNMAQEGKQPAVSENSLQKEGKHPAMSETSLQKDKKQPAVLETSLQKEGKHPAISETSLQKDKKQSAMSENSLQKEIDQGTKNKKPPQKLRKSDGDQLSYKDFKKIYKSDSTCSAVLFIKASIEHLSGRNEKALEIIKNDVFYYSIILKEYLKINMGEKILSEDFKNLVQTKSDNFSVLFYNTLILLQLHRPEYTEFLEKGIQLFPMQFTLLKMVFLIQSKDYNSLEQVLDNLQVHSIPICAISCEYYIMAKKHDKLLDMIEKMKEIDPNDSRIPLFKGMLKEEKKEDGVDEEFSKCIEIEPTFVKPYILLGNYQMQNNDQKCEETFLTGLEYAFQREDVASFIGSLLLWDVQKICTQRYPQLFKTETK